MELQYANNINQLKNTKVKLEQIEATTSDLILNFEF